MHSVERHARKRAGFSPKAEETVRPSQSYVGRMSRSRYMRIARGQSSFIVPLSTARDWPQRPPARIRHVPEVTVRVTAAVGKSRTTQKMQVRVLIVPERAREVTTERNDAPSEADRAE